MEKRRSDKGIEYPGIQKRGVFEKEAGRRKGIPIASTTFNVRGTRGGSHDEKNAY